MKQSHIVLIALIVLIAGAAIIFGIGQKAEAPVAADAESSGEPKDEAPVVTAPMPAPGAEGVNEMIVVKEFTVSGSNFAYSPFQITVKQGDRVKITFENTGGFHDFVIDGYGVDTTEAQSPNTQVIEFTADKSGSFEYYCSVGTHRAQGMKGTLVVE